MQHVAVDDIDTDRLADCVINKYSELCGDPNMFDIPTLCKIYETPTFLRLSGKFKEHIAGHMAQQITSSLTGGWSLKTKHDRYMKDIKKLEVYHETKHGKELQDIESEILDKLDQPHAYLYAQILYKREKTNEEYLHETRSKLEMQQMMSTMGISKHDTPPEELHARTISPEELQARANHRVEEEMKFLVINQMYGGYEDFPQPIQELVDSGNQQYVSVSKCSLSTCDTCERRDRPTTFEKCKDCNTVYCSREHMEMDDRHGSHRLFCDWYKRNIRGDKEKEAGFKSNPIHVKYETSEVLKQLESWGLNKNKPNK